MISMETRGNLNIRYSRGFTRAGTDYGRSQDFRVHRVICGAGKPGQENIANLDKLPVTGAMLYGIPLLIKGGTGAPARVFAILS